MMKKTTMRKMMCLYLVLLISACLCLPAICESAAEEDRDTMLSWPFSAEIRDTYTPVTDRTETAVYSSENSGVTFMAGPMPYGPVADEEEAAFAAADFASGTGLNMAWLRTDAYGGVICYTFRAMEDGLELRNCCLKIIANDEGKILGIASSLPDNTDDIIRDDPDEEYQRQAVLDAEYESAVYEVSLETLSGKRMEGSVPVLVSPENGSMYLGDTERRIYCVDSASLGSGDGENPVIRPLCLDDLSDTAGPVITYYRFLQVYDYFAAKGWLSPDGNGSPCVLSIDFSGDTNGNAAYGGFGGAFHYFSFGTGDGASQSIQVIAHEFMHGVSAANHIGRYENETGALNEAISDLIGSAVEADIEGWTLEQDNWLQSFRTSHRDEYPLFVWDEYYTPATDVPDQSVNDLGSVHHNANIVNMLAYRQAEAGMTPAERFDYWFLFDLTLTPVTDFPELAARAAWCAEIAGLSGFAPVMEQAVADLGLDDRSVPDEPRLDHQALVLIDMVWQNSDLPGIVTFYNTASGNEFSTWPVAGTDLAAAVLSEGEYVVSIVIHSDPEAYYLWDGEDWQPCGQEEIEAARGEAGSAFRLVLKGGDVVGLDHFEERE